MPIISYQLLNQISLEMAKESIRRYGTQNGTWVDQFNSFYRNTRLNSDPDIRMTELMNIVRYNRWNMNRQGQCARIIDHINKGTITFDHLKNFWNLVDELPNIDLRDLPSIDNHILNQLVVSFRNIREILTSWHPSAGSVCFLTKVILMFNWGQSPAFDTRIREILKVGSNISDEELVQSLVDIGTWIQYFETKNGIYLNELLTDVLLRTYYCDLHQLPLGRIFDMMLFSLRDLVRIV